MALASTYFLETYLATISIVCFARIKSFKRFNWYFFKFYSISSMLANFGCVRFWYPRAMLQNNKKQCLKYFFNI